MADVDFDEFDDGYGATEGQAAARSARFSHLVNLAGAASSVVLVIGLGVWGYKLAVRDVTGIPVIRAIEGPMRVAPENPGGEVAAHQGLAVNDVAAVGTASPPPETLILAPRPVELTDEDEAGEELNGAVPAVPDTALAPVVVPLAPLVTDEPQGADPDAVAKALAEALATDPEAALTEDEAAGETLVEDAATLDPAAEPAAEATAPPATVRPRARPAALMAAAPVAAAPVAAAPVAEDSAALDAAPSLGEAPAPAAPAAEVDPAMISAGTRLVQLGAFDTADQARAEWVKLGTQFGPAFAGKALVVQSAESGGRTFYRLRAHGFADETETRSFCMTLLEQNVACIPVEQR